MVLGDRDQTEIEGSSSQQSGCATEAEFYKAKQNGLI